MTPIVGRLIHRETVAEGAIAQLGERVVRNDEVGGSIPPGSTSLRRLRLLRLGMPPRSEGCPAIARRATADHGKSYAVKFSRRLRLLRLGMPPCATAASSKPTGRRRVSAGALVAKTTTP